MQNKTPRYPFKMVANPLVEARVAYPSRLEHLFNQKSFEDARNVISLWPDYEVTPLHSLAGMAKAVGVDKLYYKDESERFGLGSFKPLGGAYAVTCLLARILLERNGIAADQSVLLQSGYAANIADITVTAATDGNHGRSVAWGAKCCGCKCVIYIHQHVSAQRERAIAELGASVVRVKGNYDDSVRQAFKSAEAPDWHIIQDTTEGVAADNTLNVMHGYTLMADEAITQLGEALPPTHLFLQAGVGGMAAAVLARFWVELGENSPVVILAEPGNAACCFRSIEAGQLTVVEGDQETIMAGLACGEVSSLAWEVLRAGAHAALIVDDDSAADCMRLLANQTFGDRPVVAGESAVAGLVGLMALMNDEEARDRLCLGDDSRVMVFGTEGATDPQLYREIVGRNAEEVLSGVRHSSN